MKREIVEQQFLLNHFMVILFSDLHCEGRQSPMTVSFVVQTPSIHTIFFVWCFVTASVSWVAGRVLWLDPIMMMATATITIPNTDIESMLQFLTPFIISCV